MENNFQYSLKVAIEEHIRTRATKLGEQLLEEHIDKIKKLMMEAVAHACIEVFNVMSMQSMGNTLIIEVRVPNQIKEK